MAIKRSFGQLMLILSAVLIVSVLFQNCGKPFELTEMMDSASLQATSRCFDDKNLNACIFRKNPWQQAGVAVSVPGVGYYQNYGVNLSELDSSGYLQSSSFVVRNSSGARAQKIDGAWKYSFGANPKELSQVMAYYTLTDAKNFFKNRTGVFYAENRALKVNVDSSFAGFSGTYGEINLDTAEGIVPMALDGSLVVNLLGHANAYYASSGLAIANQDSSAQNCVNKKGALMVNHCCKSSVGCGPAILAGQADYMTAVYYSDAGTALGESWASSMSGLSTCGLPRDVGANSSLTATSAYAACSGYGASGSIYAMGTLYGSIWWEARKKVTDTKKFDLFFMKHLEVIRGEDTFSTIQTKLQTLDQSQFASAFYSTLRAEFQRRGL